MSSSARATCGVTDTMCTTLRSDLVTSVEITHGGNLINEDRLFDPKSVTDEEALLVAEIAPRVSLGERLGRRFVDAGGGDAELVCVAMAIPTDRLARLGKVPQLGERGVCPVAAESTRQGAEDAAVIQRTVRDDTRGSAQLS